MRAWTMGILLSLSSIVFGKEEAPLSKKKILAELVTSKGSVVCELYPESAPISVETFVHLSSGGAYDGFKFYRVVEGNTLVLAGNPLNLLQDLKDSIPQEILLPHQPGSLAWARLPDHLNEDKSSLTSQFYITTEALSHLDGQYTVFGKVISGLDTIKQIEVGDKIEKIEISSN